MFRLQIYLVLRTRDTLQLPRPPRLAYVAVVFCESEQQTLSLCGYLSCYLSAHRHKLFSLFIFWHCEVKSKCNIFSRINLRAADRISSTICMPYITYLYYMLTPLTLSPTPHSACSTDCQPACWQLTGTINCKIWAKVTYGLHIFIDTYIHKCVRVRICEIHVHK